MLVHRIESDYIRKLHRLIQYIGNVPKIVVLLRDFLHLGYVGERLVASVQVLVFLNLTIIILKFRLYCLILSGRIYNLVSGLSDIGL